MKTKAIDLHLPKGWQDCTTEELETIAAALISAQFTATRLHPFDWTEVKTRLFFALTGLEVVAVVAGVDGVDAVACVAAVDSVACVAVPQQQTRRMAQTKGAAMTQDERGEEGSGEFTVRMRDKRNWWRRFIASLTSHPSPLTTDESFPIAVWQVHSFIGQHLKWLDATDAKGRPLPMPMLMFPYPERLRRWTWRLWRREYHWPGGELLDGMSWQTYRWINDWMEVYTQTANRLVEARQRKSPDSVRPLLREEKRLRTKIAALIFGCPEWRARTVSEVEWQVLMFWWSSMMQYLKTRYPKCFKASTTRGRVNRQQALPVELYTRSMATLQKYLGGLTEEQINGQSAHDILQHLNDMAVEAEEMEKLKRKHG